MYGDHALKGVERNNLKQRQAPETVAQQELSLSFFWPQTNTRFQTAMGDTKKPASKEKVVADTQTGIGSVTGL